MKKILIISASVIGLIALFGYKKYRDGITVLQHLGIRLKKAENISFEGNNIVFDVVVELINPTDIAFSLNTGSLASLERLEFYSKTGKYIGFSNVNLSKIDLPANSATALPPLKTSINFFKGVDYIFQGQPDIKTTAILKGLGKEYKIQQP